MKKQYICPRIAVVKVDFEALLAAESTTRHDTDTTGSNDSDVPPTGGSDENSGTGPLAPGNSFWDDEW